MGFIDYHGTKEDRYTEVLEYARAQQEEDWNRKEEQKITLWLRDLTGSSSYAQLNVDDLIKDVILKYRFMETLWTELTKAMKSEHPINKDQIWKDFYIDLASRHLNSFHLSPERRNKYLQTFLVKVFRLTELMPAEEHYQKISSDPKYRQYFTECFDPTWKGQQFFKWLQSGVKKNKDGEKLFYSFLDADSQMSLLLGLYLHQVILPHDDGWMREIEAERKALSDIRSKAYRGKLFPPDIRMLVNPLYRPDSVNGEDDIVQTGELAIEVEAQTKEKPGTSSIPNSGLDKKIFFELIQRGSISNYVSAAKLLLECDLPEEISQIFFQLIDRMPVLQDAVDRFDDIYHADMDQFEEYFAPEALKITSVYLDYQAVKPSEKILRETRDNVFLATRKLLQVVNDKIDEIYRFVTIDANAEAKALETIMSQDGHVDPAFRIKQ